MAARTPLARRALAVVLFLLLLPPLLVLELWAFLRTPWGASVLAGQVESRLSDALAGTFRIGELGTFGTLGFRLRHVLVLDPTGAPTIAVEDLRVKIDPFALLRGDVVGDVSVDGARVAIVHLPAYDDVNIGLAFQPVEPGPPRERRRRDPGDPLPPDPPLPIRLRSLSIEDTAFLLAMEPGARPEVLVRGIEATGDGRWTGRGARAELELAAEAVEPVQAPLAIWAEAAFAQNWLDAIRAEVALGDTRIAAKGRGEMRALEGRIVVDGVVDDAHAKAFDVPLASDLHLTGDFWLAPDRSSVALRTGLVDGDGVIALDGWYEPPDGSLFAQVVIAGMNPAQLVEGAPQGSVTGSARAIGSLVPEPDLQVDLQLQQGRLAGWDVGPVSLAGRLEGETVSLEPSRLVLPGATVRVRGDASAEALDLEGRITARDLASARNFAVDLLAVDLPPIAGAGVIGYDLQGTPEDPEVGFDLDLTRFAWDGNEAGRVDLRGSFRLDEEGLPVGGVEGRIGRLQTGRLDARDLRVELERAPDGDFSVDARGRTRVADQRDLGRTRLQAEGRIDAGRARIRNFRFDYPEGGLRSEGEATLRFGDGGLSLEGFELRQQGAGRIAASGDLSEGRIDLELRGTNIRLERLPQALLPEDLAGRIDIDATLRGTTAAPEGSATFRLREGSFGALRDLAAEGDLAFEGGRASGDVKAALGGAGLVVARYAGPLDLLEAPPATPFEIDVRVGPVDLEGLGRALESELPAGTLRARLIGSGPVGVPEIDLDVILAGLEIPDAPELPALEARLEATLQEGLALAEAEAWAADRRVLELEAAAPLDPRRLRQRPEAEIDRMLRSAEARAEGVVRGLDLEIVGALIDQPDLTGAVVAEFDVQGPIVDPRGRVRVEARGGPVGPIRHLSVASLVELLPDRSRLLAGVAIEGQSPAEIRAEVAAPPRAFLDGTASPQTPALLEIDVPDLDLAALGGRAATAATRNLVAGSEGERRLAGTVAARGRFEGTLASLPGELRVIAQDVVLRGVPLGGVEVAVQQGERLAAWISAIDPTAGTVIASARLDGTLSPLALAQQGIEGLQDRRAEVEIRGTGLTLLPLAILSTINRAAGDLDFEARAEGALAELDPIGSLSLRNGAIELVGGPRYQDITLDLELTGERLVLARLQAAAPGRGRLAADGRLERTRGPDPFDFEVNADAFPIGGPGGVSARVSGEGNLEGTFHPREGLVATLEVPQARIRLPPSPPRELQSVSRLRDVVIVSGPEAFLRQQRQRAAAREGALPLELRIDAPRRIFVTGEDVDAELGAELVLRREETGDLVAEGRVAARRGRVRVLGRSFVLEEAGAIWGGGAVENPILALTARYQARDATAWVDVSGRAAEPVIALRSDPPLPESQIALLIAAGRTNLPGQTDPFGEPADTAEVDAASAAVSVAGSFAAQQLRSALGPRLPLDVLTLETGGEGTRLEAGTYVSERLYLGYLRNFLPEQDENANEVRAEYELSRTVSVESRFGDRGSAGVDLVWEKRIATPAQQRARRRAYDERVGEAAVDPPALIGPQDQEPIAPGEDAPAGFEPDPARREEDEEESGR